MVHVGILPLAEALLMNWNPWNSPPLAGLTSPSVTETHENRHLWRVFDSLWCLSCAPTHHTGTPSLWTLNSAAVIARKDINQFPLSMQTPLQQLFGNWKAWNSGRCFVVLWHNKAQLRSLVWSVGLVLVIVWPGPNNEWIEPILTHAMWTTLGMLCSKAFLH
jgi:hypothetical protein